METSIASVRLAKGRKRTAMDLWAVRRSKALTMRMPWMVLMSLATLPVSIRVWAFLSKEKLVSHLSAIEKIEDFRFAEKCLLFSATATWS